MCTEKKSQSRKDLFSITLNGEIIAHIDRQGTYHLDSNEAEVAEALKKVASYYNPDWANLDIECVGIGISISVEKGEEIGVSTAICGEEPYDHGRKKRIN